MTYDDPIVRALRERGMAPDEPPAPPPGHFRYHLAVEQTILSGTAPAPNVAAALRGLADQLDPPTQEGENQHG